MSGISSDFLYSTMRQVRHVGNFSNNRLTKGRPEMHIRETSDANILRHMYVAMDYH